MQKKRKKQRENKLWLLGQCLTGKFNPAEVDIRERSDHFEPSAITPSLFGFIVPSNPLLFSARFLFHLSQEGLIYCLGWSLCLALKAKSCSKRPSSHRSTLIQALIPTLVLTVLGVLTITLTPWH